MTDQPDGIHDVVVVLTLHSDMLADLIRTVDRLEQRIARLEMWERINDRTMS